MEEVEVVDGNFKADEVYGEEYEVFGLGRNDFSSIDPERMLRIPGHVFLRF